MSLRCRDIGIVGCDYVARGGDGKDALDQIVQHLGRRHGFRLTTQEVERGEFDHLDEPQRMIVARLQRQLELA
jgi:predicted small metal-binding protein